MQEEQPPGRRRKLQAANEAPPDVLRALGIARVSKLKRLPRRREGLAGDSEKLREQVERRARLARIDEAERHARFADSARVTRGHDAQQLHIALTELTLEFEGCAEVEQHELTRLASYQKVTEIRVSLHEAPAEKLQAVQLEQQLGKPQPIGFLRVSLQPLSEGLALFPGHGVHASGRQLQKGAGYDEGGIVFDQLSETLLAPELVAIVGFAVQSAAQLLEDTGQVYLAPRNR